MPGRICGHCGFAARAEAKYCPACGTALPIDLASGFAPGQRLGPGGRYSVVDQIGRGGFAEVYSATDASLGDRLCVLKRLAVSPRWTAEQQATVRELFRRETRLLVAVNARGHPNIPDIYDYLPEHECYVLKYVAGQSLQQLLDARAGGLPEAEALAYARAVCSALVYLHEQPGLPILHLDVSPANILLDETGRVWLIDFGIADQDDGRRRELSFGKRDYSPPEQWAGRAEPRSDVYALAVTLQVLLTNRLPGGAARTPAPQRAGVTPPVDPPESGAITITAPGEGGPHQLGSALQPDVAALIGRALDQNPEGRPSSRAFLEALDAIVVSRELPPAPQPVEPPATPAPVGREQERQALETALRAGGLAVVAGPPGIGKTALVAAVARGWQPPEAVFWHSFRAGEGAEALAWAMAGFLAWHGSAGPWRFLHSSRRVGGDTPPLAVVLDYLINGLKGGAYLLVLDDLQVADEEPELSAALARLVAAARVGELTIIAATRHRPDFLSGRDAAVVTLGGLGQTAARAMLTRGGLTLDEGTLGRLYALTEGNPQLLLLAAEALGRASDPASVLERLPDSQGIEGFLLREVDEGLAPDERPVMLALALLPGYGATRPAVEAALGAGSARRALRSLVDRHLLAAAEGRFGREYRPHGMVQAFYADEGRPAERAAMQRRLGAFYAEVEFAPLRAATHYHRGGDDEAAAAVAAGSWLTMVNQGQARALDGLLGELRPAGRDPIGAAALALTRGRLAALLGKVDVAEAALAEALAALGPAPEPGEAALLAARAHRELARLGEQRDYDHALAHLERGLVLAAGSPADEAELQVGRGAVLMYRGDYDGARAALARVLELVGEAPSRLRAAALRNLAGVTFLQGDLSMAAATVQEALEVCKALGDEYEAVRATANLGTILYLRGEWRAATEALRGGLAIAQRIGDAHGSVGLHGTLGLCYAALGSQAQAEEETSVALSLARSQELAEFVIIAAFRLAELRLRVGDLAGADGLLAEAEGLVAGDDHEQLPNLLCARAEWHLAAGEPAKALACAERAVGLTAEDDDPVVRGMLLRTRGRARLAAGAVAEGRADLEAAVALIGEADAYEAARARLDLAATLPAEQGLALRDAARATFETLGARYDLHLLEEAWSRGTR